VSQLTRQRVSQLTRQRVSQLTRQRVSQPLEIAYQTLSSRVNRQTKHRPFLADGHSLPMVIPCRWSNHRVN